MEINWETPARLQSEHPFNLDCRKMPTTDGTLRDCVLAAIKWPGDAISTIFLDKRVMGKTILNRADIQELAKMLGEPEGQF